MARGTLIRPCNSKATDGDSCVGGNDTGDCGLLLPIARNFCKVYWPVSFLVRILSVNEGVPGGGVQNVTVVQEEAFDLLNGKRACSLSNLLARKVGKPQEMLQIYVERVRLKKVGGKGLEVYVLNKVSALVLLP